MEGRSNVSLERIRSKRLLSTLDRIKLPSSKTEIYPDRPEAGQPQYQTSFATSPTIVAFVHLTKALLGPTVLAIPGGFKQGGLAFSPFALAVLVLLIAYNIRRLIISAMYLSDRNGTLVRTYDEVAFVSFENCSNWTRNHAHFLKNLVNLLFFIAYLDALIIFMIFIGRNVESLMLSFAPELNYDVRHYIFLEVMLLMCVASFRELRHLFPFSVVSSVLIVLVILAVIAFVFLESPTELGKDDATDWYIHRTLVGDIEAIVRFICTVLFCFSGLSVSLTLKSSMKNPQSFFSGPSIYYVSVILSTTLFISFGLLGFLKYGEYTQASVLLNIAPKSDFFLILKIITIISVFLTCPLVFYVAFNVAWKNLFKNSFNPVNILFAEYFVRYGLIVLCCIIAILFPNLGGMIVLKGALFHSHLEVTLPAVLDYVTFYPEKGSGKYHCRLFKMVSIVTCGVLFFVAGVTVSVMDMDHGGDG